SNRCIAKPQSTIYCVYRSFALSNGLHSVLGGDDPTVTGGITNSSGDLITSFIFEHFDEPLECPALFVPVKMRQTGTRGSLYGAREEAYSGADCEPAAAG